MAKHYLVTGGSGFLGSALVRRLVRDGHRVRAFDNNLRGHWRRLDDVRASVELVEGDIRDAAAVDRAAGGVDAVCHLAFINGTEYFYSLPDLVLEVGVRGMLNVLDACSRHNVGELMLMSSSEVYQEAAIPTPETAPLTIPDPHNPRYSYAAGKLISEVLALQYARRGRLARVVVVRPHNVYGPDMGNEHVIPQFLARMRQACSVSPADPLPFPIQGSGEQTRAFVHVDDFIDGLLLAMERGENLGIYHVGTMEEISIAALAHRIGACYGRHITVIPGPEAAGGTPRRCPDIARMRGLGYSPQWTLARGLSVTAAWYDQHAALAGEKIAGSTAQDPL